MDFCADLLQNERFYVTRFAEKIYAKIEPAYHAKCHRRKVIDDKLCLKFYRVQLHFAMLSPSARNFLFQ